MIRGGCRFRDPGTSGAVRRVTRALLALAALSMGACGRDDGKGALIASGHVEAADVRIATKVPGHLREFALQEGDRVVPGQVLARVDTTDASLALAMALARLAQAEAELRLKVAGNRTEDVMEAEAQVASAEAHLSGTTRDLERVESLLESGSASVQQRDDLRTRRDMAAAALSAARERRDRLRHGSRAEEIQGSRASLEAARAQVAQYRQQLSDAVIISPLAGIVTRKLVEPGELLAAGAALCIVTNLEDAWLTAYVPGPELARIRLGQAATVRTDDGQSRTGHITYISPEAEFTPRNVQTRDERVKLVHRIKIGLPNADGLFKPGMPAEAAMERAAP